MKKIINEPDNYLKEMLSGIYIAHEETVTFSALCLNTKKKEKSASPQEAVPVIFLCSLAMLEKACWTAAAWVTYFNLRVQIRCLP